MADVQKLMINNEIYNLVGGTPIYEELGISMIRFAELLSRDAYTPYMDAAPTADTKTYIDTDGSENTFRIGQSVVYSDPDSDDGYGIAFLKAILEDGTRVWGAGGGGSGDTREKVRITLVSDQSESDPNLIGATVVVHDNTLDEDVLSTTWRGEELLAKVTALSEYTITVGSVNSYSTPSAKSFTAAIAYDRSVSFTYVYSAVKVNILSNQSEDDTIAVVKATVSYGSDSVEVASGETVGIPTDQQVTISFPVVDGYKNPDNIVFTNSSGGLQEKNGTYQTEMLTVNVTSDGTPAGYAITVGSLGTQTEQTKTWKVPYGTRVTVSASDVEGYTTPASQTFTAGSVSRTITMTYTKIVAIDLSMQDIHGVSLSSRSTANCYVVKRAGTYMFPLVYGNAIKNGSENTSAYTKVSGDYSHDFVNHLDNQITSPYIEDHSGCTAADVELSISDTDGVFADLSLMAGSTCRFVKFTVTSVPTVGANGVISIKDSSGNVIWSWHIWLWADDLTPVEITNSGGANYSILPVNLASKWDDSSKARIKNWFYQWGRSVPFLCPSAYNSTSDHASYGAKSLIKSSKASTIGQGIKNPTTFYYNVSSPYNWFGSTSYYNLWDANCTSTGYSDNTVVKTVYDPCPVGFKMPNGNTFTGFGNGSTVNAVGSFDAGYKFKRNSSDTTGLFFPASGRRNRGSGDLNDVGSNGYVWLACANSQNYAGSLGFNSGFVNPQSYNYRANGFAVRPVQE
ncbi:MAG: hypothetical protein ACI4C3_01095 [Bacteroides sp.]